MTKTAKVPGAPTRAERMPEELGKRLAGLLDEIAAEETPKELTRLARALQEEADALRPAEMSPARRDCH